MRRGEGRGSEPGFRHPSVVIQNDIFNASNVHTTAVAVLTSNLSRAGIPGNVLVKKGEANLTRPSVVNVLQIQTIDKSDLLEKIGHLSQTRIQETARTPGDYRTAIAVKITPYASGQIQRTSF